MATQWSQVGDVNVLASAADWAWPDAVRNIFRPRGVNLLMAENAGEFVNIIATTRIHTAIVDADSQQSSGLTTIKIIRRDYPLVPCIVLTHKADKTLLGKALQLDAAGVIAKPVNMDILQQLLNRVFLKRYNSDLFAR